MNDARPTPKPAAAAAGFLLGRIRPEKTAHAMKPD
jgi:hypothetical protein